MLRHDSSSAAGAFCASDVPGAGRRGKRTLKARHVARIAFGSALAIAFDLRLRLDIVGFIADARRSTLMKCSLCEEGFE
jgi:hypothetical protein